MPVLQSLAASLILNMDLFLIQQPAAHPSVISFVQSSIKKIQNAQTLFGQAQAGDEVDRVINNLNSAAQISDSGTFLPNLLNPGV